MRRWLTGEVVVRREVLNDGRARDADWAHWTADPAWATPTLP